MADEKEHRDRVRIKLVTSMMTTYGYALLGGALWQPLIQLKGLPIGNVVATAVALGMHAAAIYISPRGEPK